MFRDSLPEAPDSVSSSAACFPPVARSDALVLVLGSMPGERSLEASQYYAHARNAFWPIMDALFGVDATAPYTERLDGLVRNRVALWDVLGTCDREGSLDSRIRNPVANDFNTFFAEHPSIMFPVSVIPGTQRTCIYTNNCAY